MPDIEYAFLADAAEVVPGQKFHVLGGGISRLSGPSLPIAHPHLSIVVGLRMTATERKREHDLGFVVTAPTGEQITSSGGRVIASGPPDSSDVVLNLAVDLWNLTLPVAGEYVVRILVDGTERKLLPLLVTVSREPVQDRRYLA
jgi:hypothetical protein